MRALADALVEHFGSSVEFQEPRGGMFLWVKFPAAGGYP